MAGKDQDEALREAAAHRGFRLVKSRRRTPGVGDYGRYGLADAKTGKECIGFSADGLTATAEDIATYLRGSAAATWQRSADTTPAAPRRPDPPAAPPPTPRRAKAAPPKPSPPPPPTPALRATPAPKAEPTLSIRPATKADAASVATLLRELDVTLAEPSVAAHIAAQMRAKAPLLVADRGGILGILDWHVLTTLHRGKIGRIALILVSGRARREGIGRALIAAAEAAMAQAGCERIEAISDIEIRNANGFFRATGFEQTSYRLIRAIDRAKHTKLDSG